MFFSNLYYILTEIVSSYFCKPKFTINKYARVSDVPVLEKASLPIVEVRNEVRGWPDNNPVFEKL